MLLYFDLSLQIKISIFIIMKIKTWIIFVNYDSKSIEKAMKIIDPILIIHSKYKRDPFMLHCDARRRIKTK